MIKDYSPILAKAAISIKPEDILARKGSWFKFSSKWPKGSYYDWATGGVFKVSSDPILTKYPISRVLYSQDYVYLDISNQVPPGTVGATFSLQMYPADTMVIYQIVVGMRKGNYFVQLFIPKSIYVYNLGSNSIYPDITNSTYRYLGAKRPEDSPADAPLWTLYAISQQPAFIIAPYVDQGINFEKASLEFNINKCQLTAINETLTDANGKTFLNPEYIEAKEKGTLIEYYTELTGF